MKKWLWLLIIAIVLLGSFSVLEAGKHYFGKSYLETIDFDNELTYFENTLIALELDPLNAEAIGPVTEEEIEEYRTRFGSLSEQIQSIQDQYNPDIEEAVANNNDSMEKILIEERDSKIDAVRSNFSDNEVVREKVIAEQKSDLEQAIDEMKTEKLSFMENYNYFTYNLTDLDTGETFKKGELQNNSYFEKEYTSGNPLMMSSDPYVESAFTSGKVELPLSDARFEGIIQIDRSLLEASSYGNQFELFTFTKYMLYLLAGVAISGIVLLLTKLPFNKDWFTEMPAYQKWGRLSLEIRLFLLLLTVMLAVPYASTNFITTLQHSWSDSMLEYGSWLAWDFIRAAGLLALAVLQAIWLWASYRDWENLEGDIKKSFTFRSLQMAGKAFLKKSVGGQMLILLIVVFFWGMGTMLVVFVREAIIIWVPATLFIGIPVLLFI